MTSRWKRADRIGQAAADDTGVSAELPPQLDEVIEGLPDGSFRRPSAGAELGAGTLITVGRFLAAGLRPALLPSLLLAAVL